MRGTTSLDHFTQLKYFWSAKSFENLTTKINSNEHKKQMALGVFRRIFTVSTRKRRIRSKYRRQLQLNANRVLIQSNEMVNTLQRYKHKKKNDEDEHAEKR